MIHVADVGTITNQLAVDGQIYGGMAQGIGLALTEDFEHIKPHSNMIGAGFPFCNDITDDLEIIYVCEPREHGFKGCRRRRRTAADRSSLLGHQRHRQRLRGPYPSPPGLPREGAPGPAVQQEGLRRGVDSELPKPADVIKALTGK
jgi:hypothetical protein